jgi:hypothetical protein
VVDRDAIRERAGDVIERMSQDCGPITAEPFAGWARREALDVLALDELVVDSDAGESEG